MAQQAAEVVATSEAEATDVSGALAWAADCAVDGQMRTWIDMEGHASVGGYCIGCDVMLWTASLVLLRWLERESGLDWTNGPRIDGARAPLRVLELSAGAGHLAVRIARLGAHVTASECSEEHDTNAWRALNAWVPLLQRPDPGVRGGTLETRLLNWGDEDGLTAASLEEFDVLILSELVALGEDLQAQSDPQLPAQYADPATARSDCTIRRHSPSFMARRRCC